MTRFHCRMVALFLVIALGGASRAESPMNPGKWEITTTTEMAGMPPQSITHVQCITDDDPVPMSGDAKEECRITDIQIQGNTISWKISCGGQDHGMSGTGQVTYTEDRMHGTMQMTITGYQTQVTNTLTGRRLGDCDGPAPASYTELILGEWDMVPYGGVASGTIVFFANGRHETAEKHVDGTGVGRKGGFKLDTETSPVRIQICLGECGAPGSEWTTMFGIMRFHSKDRVEIRFSPHSSYPAGFMVEDTGHTMILNRKMP